MIFVVIIALWAAYLVPHWLRRREELSAARSVDRFSTAMRVLSRRPASEPPSRGSGPRWSSERVPLARPASGSYVVMPAREVGTDVVVKRARPVDAPVSSASPAAERSILAQHSKVTPAQRRARLLVCLGGLTAVGWLLVALTPLPWMAAAAPTTLLVLDVALLVAAARRRSRATVAAPQVTGSLRDVAPVPVQPATVQPATVQPASFAPTITAGAATDSAVGHSAQGSVLDLTRLEGDGYVDVRETGAASAEADPAAGWVPVPVPPPTYTLKAKARPAPSRPLASPTPAHTIDADPGQPGAARERDEHAASADAAGDPLDLDVVLARRRAVNQ